MSKRNSKADKQDDQTEKAAVTLPGTVEKIIPPAFPSDPEKAQVAVEGADDLYRELRVENTLTSESGEEVKLKPGAKVEVTIEADSKATAKKTAAQNEGS